MSEAPKEPERPNFIDWETVYPTVDKTQINRIDLSDEQWLDFATKEFVFDDEDRFKEFVDQLKQVGWFALDKNPNHEQNDDAFDEVLEEIKELTELNSQNNVNLCRMGGMSALLAIIVKHPTQGIRSKCARLFAAITSNNEKVQKFAAKCGALNLAHQFEAENKPQMKEVILSALLSFIKAANVPAKRQFLFFYRGVSKLSSWIKDESKYGNDAQIKKIRMKLTQFLYDLVNNDDSILEFKPQTAQEMKAKKPKEPFFVRVEIGNDKEVIDKLLSLFDKDVDLTLPGNYQLRDYTLKCLQKIYRLSDQLEGSIEGVLGPHLAKLKAFTDEERKEQVGIETEEVTKLLAIKAERAQNVKDQPNFPKVKPASVQLWENDEQYIGVATDRGCTRSGPGIYKWPSGEIFDGTYVNNKRNGQGTYYWTNGDKYVGDWKDGKMHGYGVYTTKDGKKYEGNYDMHLRHGQGTFFWPDGEKYDGEWSQGLKHGKGEYTWTEKPGQKLAKNPITAQWINDVMVK